MQQAQATAAHAASIEACFAMGDATVQNPISRLEGRLVVSEAKLAHVLVAIQAGLSAVKTSDNTLANALAQMSQVVYGNTCGAGTTPATIGQPPSKRRRGGSTSAKGPLGRVACERTSCRPTGQGAWLEWMGYGGGVRRHKAEAKVPHPAHVWRSHSPLHTCGTS